MADGDVPYHLTTLIGRQSDVEAVRQAITDSRLVTLTGVGGIGKTRLAIEVLTGLQSNFADGARFVDLAAISDGNAMSRSVLRVVDVPDGRNATGTVTERLVETLRAREILLVLDNCEQVTDATAHLVAILVGECPHLRFVVTSREALSLKGERVIAVEPLGLPSADDDQAAIAAADAVVLFCDRARLRNAGFSFTSANAGPVAEICRRVDGIPLAIELAASRAGVAGPEEILERMGSLLRLLSDPSGDRGERHRSLRSTLDWSYDLLEPFQRDVFRRCAVFSGGFDLRAAETVVGGPNTDRYDVLDAISQLVDKSLLTASGTGGRVRYRMLATIREYAQDKFSESQEAEEVRARHAGFYRDLASDAGQALTGPDEVEWVALVGAELDNITTAVQWALSTYRLALATDAVLGLAVMQMAFDETIGALCEAVLAYPHPEQDPRRQGLTVFACYVRYFFRGVSEAAGIVRQLVDSSELARLDPVRLNLLNLACGLALLNGWPFRELSDRYVDAARESDDRFHLVHALASRAWACILEGADAGEAGRSVIELAVSLGNPSALAIAYQAEAMACSVEDPARAVTLLDASISEAAGVRSHFTQNVSQSMRSTLLARSLSPKVAAEALLDALESPLGQRVPGMSPIKLFEVAALLVIGGRPEPAAVILGSGSPSAIPTPVLWPFAPKEFRSALQRLPAVLGESRWTELRDQGRALTPEGLVALARREVAHLPAG